MQTLATPDVPITINHEIKQLSWGWPKEQNQTQIVLVTLLVSLCCCNKLLQTPVASTTHIYFLQFWRSEVQNGLHWARIQVSVGPHSFPEALRKNLVPCLFQLLETAYIPWLVAPFHLQRQQWSFDIFKLKALLVLTLWF